VENSEKILNENIGQRHPGLGVGKKMGDMLIHLAETHGK
jgi:hypothetical protein